MNSSTNNPGQPSDRGILEENLEFLRQLPFFANTSLETVRLYAYLSQRENYLKEELIVMQGEPCDRMFLIMSGKIAICEDHHGREFHLQTLSADGFNYFGELALLSQFDWFFSARAVTDVKLLSITREAFQKVMEKYPDQFPDTVSYIVQLRIKRFVDQTHYLLHHITEDAWQECTFDPQKMDKEE